MRLDYSIRLVYNATGDIEEVARADTSTIAIGTARVVYKLYGEGKAFTVNIIDSVLDKEIEWQ